MIQRAMTAEEFSLNRADLPDAGQWAELVRGVPVSHEPPDPEYGTIVLNLSKAFSSYVHETLNGYPCFDLGVLVEEKPDTILFPSVSYFLTGERFSEADKDYTRSVPDLVIELITTNARRNHLQERLTAYLQKGIGGIWIIDSQQRTAYTLQQRSTAPKRLDESDVLEGSPILNGFQIAVKDLFAEPDWAQ